MLTPETIATVKATVPVLQEHGVAITRCFYQRLFEQHPALTQVFNHSHQHDGRQAQALAAAVYAYAQHIDDPAALGQEVARIGAKHVSIGVRAEHYPVVGENLIAAIQQVLGDAATPEIISAWSQAYQQLADIFIDYEQSLAQESGQNPGGWQGLRRFRVERVATESTLVNSFYLVPADGGALTPFIPGQYISVHLVIDGQQHIRQYSLSGIPGESHYRISVKKEQNAETPEGAVSNYLHRQIQAGDFIDLSAPAGEFTLKDNEKPKVFLSGGIGITPVVSMLATHLQQHPDATTWFIHACENQQQHSFREELKALQEQYPGLQSITYYANPETGLSIPDDYQHQGYINIADLHSDLPKDAEYYLCGPAVFMEILAKQLVEQGEEAIYYEAFGPTLSLT